MGFIKSIWDAFGDAYDDMHHSNNEGYYEDYRDYNSHCESHSNNERVITSGWAAYSEFVGGPVKIVQHSENSEIQCFRPGMVYSGGQHSEYTIQSHHAISAYWSGDILYAQLDNGNICEWYGPGCPVEH